VARIAAIRDDDFADLNMLSDRDAQNQLLIATKTKAVS
jgi:hypothetical protein